MNIYTSYYAQIRNIPDNINIIAISNIIPNYYKGNSIQQLSPVFEVVKGLKDMETREDAIKKFKKQLKEFSQHDLVHILNNEDTCFICYEKCIDEVSEDYTDSEGNFCHRHIVAEWLRAGGYKVKEWRKQ